MPPKPNDGVLKWATRPSWYSRDECQWPLTDATMRYGSKSLKKAASSW